MAELLHLESRFVARAVQRCWQDYVGCSASCLMFVCCENLHEYFQSIQCKLNYALGILNATCIACAVVPESANLVCTLHAYFWKPI
jgi:hypothetical protein